MKRVRVFHTRDGAEHLVVAAMSSGNRRKRSSEKQYENYNCFIYLRTGPDFIGVHRGELGARVWGQ
jgi:hypothetical protein